MDAIFKYENTYVVIIKKDVRDGVDLNNCKELIIDKDYKRSNSLYGGRVVIRKDVNQGYRIIIDGITIKRFHYHEYGSSNYHFEVEEVFGLSQVAAILNQIENLAVDSFLDNYKKELQNLKVEFEKLSENWQQDLSISEDNDKRGRLEKLKNILVAMGCIIFSLLINMNAGLGNNHYINAYDAIISMYF